MKKIKQLLHQIRQIRMINKLSFKESGTCCIEFNGRYFYGDEAPQYLKRLHFLLKDKSIPPDCMQILFDINFRYLTEENWFLKKDDVVVEVGAYLGYHAMRLSETVKQVIAIEAEPHNFQLLCRNIQGQNNITAIELATWCRKGTISMQVKIRQENSIYKDIVNGTSTMVQCDTLDSICKDVPKIDFIRIQINGAELETLFGMTEILKKKPRLLVCALYKNRDSIWLFLNARGYRTTLIGHSIYAEPKPNKQ